ncbi:MAG: ribose-phosphate pyrophosphokinase [Candidatus Pacebacteria bacterium]|nr:ribose-phosphate pyrophosphokinase [Candidatus Paceibacterota bacterium]
MKLISGSSNLPLATKIAQYLNIETIDLEISKFANGEKRVWIKDDIAGENICLVQSFDQPVDENIVETLLLIDALERAGARHINFIIPWMGYSLQDKVFRDGEPIAARVIANIISNTYIKRVSLLDLHNSSIPGFFSIPTHHILALKPFTKYVQDNFNLSAAVIVSPDFGGLKRARTFADTLSLELENIDKHRDLYTGKVTPKGLSGDVKDKVCIIYDDVINTGGTVVETAKFLKEKGAREVHFLITHGLFAGDGLAKMNDESIDSVVITNSVHHENLPDKIKIVDVAPVLGESIRAWI